jgi:hypothetical protein
MLNLKKLLTKILNKFTWKFLGSATGSSTLSTPSSATELLILLKYGTSSGEQALGFSFSLPITALSNNGAITLSDGYALSSSAMALAQVSVSASTIVMTAFSINGTSYLPTSKMYVYYR